MSTFDQVTQKIGEAVDGIKRAAGIAGRAKEQKTELKDDVGAVKSAGGQVAEGVHDLGTAGSKLGKDVKSVVGNAEADAVETVKAAGGPALGDPKAAKAAEVVEAAKAAAPKAAAPKPTTPEAAAPKPVPKAPKAPEAPGAST